MLGARTVEGLDGPLHLWIHRTAGPDFEPVEGTWGGGSFWARSSYREVHVKTGAADRTDKVTVIIIPATHTHAHSHTLTHPPLFAPTYTHTHTSTHSHLHT